MKKYIIKYKFFNKAKKSVFGVIPWPIISRKSLEFSFKRLFATKLAAS